MELRLIILITKLNIKRVIKASHTKIVIIIGLGKGTWVTCKQIGGNYRGRQIKKHASYDS